MSSNRYTEEFKAEAVKQVIERGFSVVDVSERLGLHKHTLYGWVKKSRKDAAPGVGDMKPGAGDSAELRRLKAELRRVTEERDILKKAAAYFAKG